MAQQQEEFWSVEKDSPRYVRHPLKETNQEKVKKPKFCHLYLGVTYAILAMTCIVAANVIARRLNHYVTLELITYRGMVEIVFMVPILIHQRINFVFSRTQTPLLLLRGVLMSSMFFFNVYATQTLPFIQSQSIIFSYPICVAILGSIFLKYKFTKVKISALVTNLIGIILICQFWIGFDAERYLGIGAGILFVLIYSISIIVLKKLTLNMAPKLVVFYVSCMRFLITLSLTEFENGFSLPNIPECFHSWYLSEPVLIFLMGIALLGHATFEAEAVKLENPSAVAAIKSSIAMPLVIFSQVMIFNSVPSVSVVVGVVFVLAGSLLINVDAIVEKLSPRSSFRRLVNKINN